MSNLNEMKLARDMILNQVPGMVKKLDKMLNEDNLRMVQKHLSTLRDAVKNVETKQLRYLAAAEKEADHLDERSVMDTLQEDGGHHREGGDLH